jgi:Arc/MetJ-type ribon-helix-helix transcriptional regulator
MATQSQIDRYREAVRSGQQGSASDALREAMQYSSDNAQQGYAWDQSEKMKAVDPYAEIKRQQAALLEAQKQQRINALGQQRQSALSSLEAERGTVAPVYLQQRGNLSTTAQQTARGAEQSLAARGLTRGGSAVQGDIARNVALQQGMTDIGQAEAGTLANIAQRQTAAEQAYQQGLAQAESEAAATAAQNEIQRLMQAQQAQEATLASQTQAQFEQQKMDQEQANKLQIEQLRIAADEAAATGDFKRAQELAKFKSDLEAETIKLRASTKSSGGGGGSSSGGSASDLNVTQRSLASAIGKQIDANPGNLSAILARVTDPSVKAYLMAIYGAGGSAAQSTGAMSGLPTSRAVTGTAGTSQVPSWLNVRNLPGLG